MNSPSPTVPKTVEQMNNEMKETTKQEMAKLATLLEERIKSTENKNFEEVFLTDDNTSSDESSSSDKSKNKSLNNKLIRIITENKTDKKKKPKNNDLINNVIMVEKLKSEVDKLESRIRYKDLDLSNQIVETNKLQTIAEKFKLFKKLLNQLQEKENKINDYVKVYQSTRNETSRKIATYQLNELNKLFDSVHQTITNEEFNNNIIKLNEPLFTRLLTEKDTLFSNELKLTKYSIDSDLKFIDQTNILFWNFMFYFSIIAAMSMVVLYFWH
jgi:small-conductance mechanosensitive channel